MDHSYIIKIKFSLILNKAPAMDIKTPIATWILARLFNEDIPITKKDLLRNLCQASFDSMTDDKDFGVTIQKLIDVRYIEYTTKKHTELVPVRDNNLVFTGLGASKLQEVERTSEGYVITEDGIIAFRRQIVTPIEKIIPNVSKAPSSKTKFAEIITTLSTTANLIESTIKLCTNNAPQILDFIKTFYNELVSIGINIMN